MWAQDAAAMTGYAASSAAATVLTPFASPHQATNPDGLAAQVASVVQAEANAASSSSAAQAVLAAFEPGALLGAIPELGVVAAAEVYFDAFDSINDSQAFVTGIINDEDKLGTLPKPAKTTPAEFPVPAQLNGGAAQLSSGVPNAVTASMSRANTIGQLSVPTSWAAPSTSRVSALTPAGLTTLPATQEAAASGIPGIPGVPAPGRASGVLPRYGTRLTVMTRPPAGG